MSRTQITIQVKLWDKEQRTTSVQTIQVVQLAQLFHQILVLQQMQAQLVTQEAPVLHQELRLPIKLQLVTSEAKSYDYEPRLTDKLPQEDSYNFYNCR